VLFSVRSNATFGFRGQFTKPCLRRGWIILSLSPCLNKLETSQGTEKCCSVSILCPERELAKCPQNVLGCKFQLGIQQKSRNHCLCWIPGIVFYPEHPSLMVPTPRKLVFSSISITSALLSKKQCNIWI
jgi:hypothetical protein